MALIDIEDLREALEVGNIFPDTLLQSVCDAAAELVTPFLAFNRAAITDYQCKSNVATFWTSERNLYRTGQAVTVSGIGAHFNGNKTVIDWGDRYFTAAVTHADQDLRPLFPAGYAVQTDQIDMYDTDERARQATLMIAIDIWHARKYPSGSGEAIDFTPSPYKMGRSLYSRVSGLLQPIRDVRGMVG